MLHKSQFFLFSFSIEQKPTYSDSHNLSLIRSPKVVSFVLRSSHPRLIYQGNCVSGVPGNHIYPIHAKLSCPLNCNPIKLDYLLNSCFGESSQYPVNSPAIIMNLTLPYSVSGFLLSFTGPCPGLQIHYFQCIFFNSSIESLLRHYKERQKLALILRFLGSKLICIFIPSNLCPGTHCNCVASSFTNNCK